MDLFLPIHNIAEGGPLLWRARMMFAIYLTGIVVGSFALISSASLALRNGYWFLVALYILAYLSVIAVTFLRRISFPVRAWCGLVIFYTLGMLALVTGGPAGSGRLWLYSFSLFAVLMLGVRIGLLTLVLNASTLILLGWLMGRGNLVWPVIDLSLGVWTVGSVTFIFLNTIVTVSMAVLFRGLEEGLRKERKLAAELAESNEHLRREIDERKHMEEMLRESENKYRSLVDILSDCVYELDKDFKYIYVSPRLKDISGYEPEHYLGRTPFDFMAPGEAQRLSDMIQEGLKSPQPFKGVENSAVRKNGQIGTLETSAVPIYDSRGEHSGYLCVDRDITEHKRAENAVRESEERYRAISEDMPVLICRFLPGGEITYVNKAYCKYFAKTFDEVVGSPFFLLIPEESRGNVMAGISALTVESPTQSHEHKVIAPSGKICWHRWTNRALFDAQGNAVAYQSIGEDITERKRAEELLRQSEEKYRTIFEESKDIVYITTPEGRILDINPAGVELLGYSSREELSEANVSQDTYWNSRDREAFQKVIAEDGFVRDYEVDLKRKDGKRITLLLSANAVRDDKGTILEYRGIMHDVTERRQLEYQLHQSSKLASVGELATGVAHEINNPIAAIDVHAGLISDMLEEVRGKIDDSYLEQIHKDIGTIEQQVERCRLITNNLLSFTRIPRSEGMSFGINDLLKKTTKMVSGMSFSDTDVELKLDHELPSYRGSPNLLQQVFVNLLTNAFKATEPQGKITISTCLDDSGSIRIQLTDTGHGMTEDISDRIFDPFFTTSPEGEGTGLGLSISYYIVKQMNGEISVDSIPGQGSTFTVTLPVVDSPT